MRTGEECGRPGDSSFHLRLVLSVRCSGSARRKQFVVEEMSFSGLDDLLANVGPSSKVVAVVAECVNLVVGDGATRLVNFLSLEVDRPDTDVHSGVVGNERAVEADVSGQVGIHHY